MLAYPGGGNHGASTLTLILVLIGAGVFWRRGQRRILALTRDANRTRAFGSVIEAISVRGPSADHADISRRPSVSCPVLAPVQLLGHLPRVQARFLAFRVAVAALAVMGMVLLAEDFRHPYRAVYDYQAREFARRFWPEQSRGAELASLEWDFGIQRRRPPVLALHFTSATSTFTPQAEDKAVDRTLRVRRPTARSGAWCSTRRCSSGPRRTPGSSR